jgi:hypothetical protein
MANKDKNQNDQPTNVRERIDADPGTSPADHEAAQQEAERKQQADEQAKTDAQMAKDGPMGPQVNTPNLSASVVDGHDLSEKVSSDGSSTKGGTVSPNGNDTTRTPGPGGNTGK